LYICHLIGFGTGGRNANSQPAAIPERKLQFLMTRLIIPYSIFIIVFGLFTTLLLLASPHHVDKDFLVVNVSSLIVLPLTGYFLYKLYNGATKNKGMTIFLLLLTAVIFTYHTYDLFKNSDDISWFSFLPLAALILTLLFLFQTAQKRQASSKEAGIKSWDDYWQLFENLCSSLNHDNKQFVVTELKEAQKHVNGLTDGWHEFLDKFEKVDKAYGQTFSAEQNSLTKSLIQNLKKSLRDR
jgi:hypothetical protein